MKEDSSTIQVKTYIARKEENPPLPNREYLNLIISGAAYWGLPDDYRALLNTVEVQNY